MYWQFMPLTARGVALGLPCNWCEIVGSQACSADRMIGVLMPDCPLEAGVPGRNVSLALHDCRQTEGVTLASTKLSVPSCTVT